MNDESMLGCSLENFHSNLLSRRFDDKRHYGVHKLFLGRTITYFMEGGLDSLSHEKRVNLISSLSACASSLRSAQDQIREDKMHQKEGMVMQVWVWLKNRLWRIPTLETLIHSINSLAKNKGVPSFRVRTVRFQRFRHLIRSIKNLGKGAAIPGARVLHESYRREPTGLHFIIDGKSYRGTIYMGFFQDEKTSYWKNWRTSKNETGVLYQNLYSFEEYMNRKIIPQLEDRAKVALIRACEDVVEYYSPQELTPLEVHFSQEGTLFTLSPLFNAWAQKIEEKPADRPSFRDFVKTSSLASVSAPTPVKKRTFPFI